MLFFSEAIKGAHHMLGLGYSIILQVFLNLLSQINKANYKQLRNISVDFHVVSQNEQLSSVQMLLSTFICAGLPLYLEKLLIAFLSLGY